MRKLIFGTLVTGIVLLGMVAQAGSYLLALPAPAAAAPLSQSGEYAVGVRNLNADEAPMPVTVWYPAEEPVEPASYTYSYAIRMLDPESSVVIATYSGRAVPGAAPEPAGGPYPVVILSPGFAFSGGSYGWLAEEIAAHGFVVVSLQHAESLDPRGLWRATAERPRDVTAALDFLEDEEQPGSDFAGLIDTGMVALVGHSYGGYTALAAVGARIDPAGFETTCDIAYRNTDPLVFLCDALVPHLSDIAREAGIDPDEQGLWPAWSDPRVDAAVALAGDAAMFGPAGLAGITVPVMTIGGTADVDSPFRWGTELAFEHSSSTRKVEVGLVGAEHLIFAGECTAPRRVFGLVPTEFCSDPEWSRDEAHELISHLVVAFLQAELKQDADAAASLASELHFPEVTYRAEGY